MNIPDSIRIFADEGRGEEFLSNIWGRRPVFTCTIGNTETAKIPGLSAAGAVPEITDRTPAADMELLLYGRCRSIEGVPVTPDGIPTPAIITMSALQLTDMPTMVVNGGTFVRPQTPYVDLGGQGGSDIRTTGPAVQGTEEVFGRAVQLGRSLAGMSDYLVLGESVAGGTTTALAVLAALGYDADGKVSSSLPKNPHPLKAEVVQRAISDSGLEEDPHPLEAIEAVGDPMIPAAAGLAVGAASRIPVLLSGGTQMCAVLAVVKGIDPSVLGNLALGTTKWIIDDRESDILDLVAQCAQVPVLASGLNFSDSRYHGLRVYEEGVVKEGVGAGGSTIAAVASSGGDLDMEVMLSRIEENYQGLCHGR
ncbi:MAG: nicotinate mononucleotide-dependent phosphoribosyltransferase CobT [Methanomassiliicoccales archaeon]